MIACTPHSPAPSPAGSRTPHFVEGPTTGDNHSRAAKVLTGTQQTHSTSVAVPLMVTTVVAAEVVLLGVEVQAVVVGVILVLVPKVVVLVVVAVAPGLCLPGIPDWTIQAGPRRPAARHGATAGAADLPRPERSQATTQSTCCASASRHQHTKQRRCRDNGGGSNYEGASLQKVPLCSAGARHSQDEEP